MVRKDVDIKCHMPYTVEPGRSDESLPELVNRRRAEIREIVTRTGSVLFRGFDVKGVDEFGDVVRALSESPLPYTERSSPRSTIKGRIYTSTDYPPDQEIFLHNENSYQLSWPRYVFFYCVQAPGTQGATPLADLRAVRERLDPSVVEEFVKRGWLLVRNYYENFGGSWRYAFGTEDRAVVERYCHINGIEFEWHADDSLRTRAVRPAMRTHPGTGTPMWFNHITFFHYTTLPARIRDGLLAFFDEETLPTNTYYGDGTRIPDDVMEHLRHCYRESMIRFDWARGDLLVVDNMIAAHGREPFTGEREIAVAMTEQFDSRKVGRS